MSGAPVVGSLGNSRYWSKIIGVNAGHIEGSTGVISHFVTSDKLIEILAAMGDVDILSD
jgi:hypothetical protein